MKSIRIPILATIVTILAWLWWSDYGFSSGKEEALMKWKSLLSLSTGGDFSQVPDDFLFINTTNDLQLTEVSEDMDGIPIPIGNTSITDRAKLTELLNLLSKTPVHKYVFLDILLEKLYSTESDSALVQAINKTPRLVYASHDLPLLDGLANEKAGAVSYNTTVINNDFCKYNLKGDSVPSMAYRAYSELFASDSGIMPRSFMPRLYFNAKRKYSDPTQTSGYYSSESKILNLGVDVLNPYVDFGKLVKDKYIFIGNFDNVNDMHATYLDKMDGTQIHANVFANLLKRNHTYHPIVIAIMSLVVFTFYVLLLARYKGYTNPTGNKTVDAAVGSVRSKFINNRFVRFLLSFLTIEAVLVILFYVFAITTDCLIEISFLTVLFTLLWNLRMDRINKYITKFMNKFRKSRPSISAIILAVLLSLPLGAFSDSYKILYISTPNSIFCDNKRKTAGDTIFTGSHLKWANRNQAMRVQNLRNGTFSIIRNTPMAKRDNMTIDDYLKSTSTMAGRGDSAHTAESLRAMIPDTLMLLDKIEIPTTLSQTPMQFFFIEYELKGEKIKKRLPITPCLLTMDRDIYSVDSNCLDPFDIHVNVFYYDETAHTITIIGENKVIVPLDL